MLGNEDGYPYELDDHSLYADPGKEGRFVYVPWALDETWDTNMDWEAVTGTVAVHCAYDDACLPLLLTHVSAVLDTYEGLDVNGIAQAAMEVSVTAVQADTKRELPLADVTTARSQLLTAILNRPSAVRGQMGL